MARIKRQTIDLASVFQAVAGNLARQQADLNEADSYNHDHGDNMVEIFGAINEAMDAKRNKKPAEQLAYASEILRQRSQSGSAKIYADGLSRASQQFKGKAVTRDNLSTLLVSLLGGQAGQQPSNAPADLLGSLLGGAASGQGAGAQSTGGAADLLGSLLGGAGAGQGAASQPTGDAADLIGSLLGGAAGGQSAGSQSSTAPADLLASLLGGSAGQGAGSQAANAPADLLGSLMGGASGGQSTDPKPGLDLGDLLNAGMAFMNSQQQGESSMESIIKAFVAATQAGQRSYRAQSGEVVANTMLQMLGGQSKR